MSQDRDKRQHLNEWYRQKKVKENEMMGSDEITNVTNI